MKNHEFVQAIYEAYSHATTAVGVIDVAGVLLGLGFRCRNEIERAGQLSSAT